MSGKISILDGGMGRELLRSGAPFRQPEWSALALIEAPDFVARAHRAFADAGAEVLATNSYALVPFHIGDDRFARDGRLLADRAGRLARATAVEVGARVAGSLPPAFGSYRGELADADAAQPILATLVAGLSPHIDLWLAETLSALVEADAARRAIGDDPRPLWLSFTLADADIPPDRPARLRSGESVADAAARAAVLGAEALLFNCSQPEVMEAAVREARAALAPGIAVGVYANAFPPTPPDAVANSGLSDIRHDLDPEHYLGWARRWVDAGAAIVGGCCGIGPEHIAVLAEAFRRG
jgi:S-methylmethionine-dependent homocysteine/selenocysteine methylase